ncbi:glycosyltransferase [bacterium]|nr:glycosyltransferase [bacterium]
MSQPNRITGKDVSIIIPVFNESEFTARCLEAISMSQNKASYEVIVIDNGSTDATKELLASVEGDITVITNRSNEGFARACNRGSRLATGEYLLFLNNDTLVSDAYLDQMIECAATHPMCGAVGARLQYPSGRIQHAGIAINSEGIPYHIFQNFDVSHEAVSETREMIAVTAACMLIRRETFASLNGFDSDFVNGFEDVDLCLRLSEAGYRNYYCGVTGVVHFEETSKGRKQFDAQNLALLQRKWNHRLLQDDVKYLSQYGLTIEWASHGGTYRKIDVISQNKDSTAADDVQVLLDLAQKKYVEGLHEDAAELLKRVVSSRMKLGKDDEFESWQLLGNCMTRLNKAEEAERAYLRAANANRNSERPFLGLGSVAMLQENWTAAQYGFLAALSKKPDAMRAEFGLGVSMLARSQFADALQHFVRVVDAEPGNAEAVFYLYRSAMEAGTPQAAIGPLSRYLENYPADAEFWFHLTGALWKNGSLDDAVEACQKVLELAPEHADAQKTLEYMTANLSANA